MASSSLKPNNFNQSQILETISLLSYSRNLTYHISSSHAESYIYKNEKMKYSTRHWNEIGNFPTTHIEIRMETLKKEKKNIKQ